MLHSYAFANFQSFRDRVEVDLTLSRKVPMTNWMVEVPTGERVSKLMAVVGPNGSGKTALIKPMAFLGWFVSQSFHYPPDAGIPLSLHASSMNEPAEFECTVDFDGKLWRYVLRCTPSRVLHEALYQKKDRFNYVFVRDWDESANAYVVKQQEFGLPAQEARRVRPNVSLISWASQFGVPLALRMAAPYLISNVNVIGRVHMADLRVYQAAAHFSALPEQKEKMSRLLSAWDLGLSGVDLREISANNPQDPNQKIWMPMGKHWSHGKEFDLPFAFESSGTQAAFVLLSQILPALEMGGLAVMDEFENDLHPHMLEPILDLFADPATNPHQAQLLFTCHAVEVMNLIQKSQVMLVQKDENCESAAIRMDKVEGIRSDDNFYAKYMAGAYGAVPQF